MKYLTVIRHAKSSWDQPGVPDHDRVLNDRGRRAAPAVAAFLHRTYFGGGGGEKLLPSPDRLVSSTAMRAMTTAQIMRDTFGMTADRLLLDSKLYLASPQVILDAVRGFDEKWNHVCIFGHNPGLHEFADEILARASVPKMPPKARAPCHHGVRAGVSSSGFRSSSSASEGRAKRLGSGGVARSSSDGPHQ